MVIRYRERDQQEVVKVDYDLSNAAPETPLKYPSINECRMFPYFLLQRYGVDRFEEGIMFREAKDGNGIDEAMGCGS